MAVKKNSIDFVLNKLIKNNYEKNNSNSIPYFEL